MGKKLLISVFLSSLIAILLQSGFSRELAAQGLTPSFWRYDAPGRLNLVEVADVDGDGIDEVLLVSNDNNLMLLGADGVPHWESPYRANSKIFGIGVADFIEEETNVRQIVLGTEDQLLLLNSDGEENWRRSLGSRAAHLEVSQPPAGNLSDIILTLENGQLQRFNGNGQLLWEFDFLEPPSETPDPKIFVDDLNNDGSSELVFVYNTIGDLSQLVLINALGETAWERPTNGTVTDVEIVSFSDDGQKNIAVATSLDRVYLYNIDGSVSWPYRSPNKEITTLSSVELEQGPALIVGTSAGTVLAYDPEGRKYWSGRFSDSADRAILSASSSSGSSVEDSLNLGIIIGANPDGTDLPELLLLNSSGQPLKPPISTPDTSGLSQLVDLNHDGQSEVLVAGFATIELTDPGIGVRQYSPTWDYRLGAEPTAAEVADINQDGMEELLVGTADGNVYVLSEDGSLLWQTDLGETVTHISIAQGGSETLPRITAVSNNISPDPDPAAEYLGWITVVRPDGRVIWSEPSRSSISALTTGDINGNDSPEIVIGTTDGLVAAYSLDGDQFWQAETNTSVDHLLLIEGTRGKEILIGSGSNTVERLNNKGAGPIRIARYLDDITSLTAGPMADSSLQTILASLEDSTVRALDSRGNQIWSTSLDAVPQTAISANNSLLINTDDQSLIKLNTSGDVEWRLADMGRITDLYWGDLNGDIKADVAVGNREGLIQLLDGEKSNTWEVLNAASEIFFVSGLKGIPQEFSDLVSVNDNGVVTLFRSQANHPPLLFNPTAEVGPGTYGISISAIDLDSDPIDVSLEIFDPESASWENVGVRRLSGGTGTLFWQVDPPSDESLVRYRFLYNDGSHAGRVEPAIGPRPLGSSALNATFAAAAALVIGGVIGTGLMIRRARRDAERANRFFNRLIEDPSNTLIQLDLEYQELEGSPDFLLNLAEMARQYGNKELATLADGLYLLGARPESAISIILSALSEAEQLEPRWWTLSQWLITFKIGNSLLSAPTITELALLRPQFEEALDSLNSVDRKIEVYLALQPILTSIRDAERVENVQDRLIYLSECASMLEEIQKQKLDWPIRIDNTLALGIADRWHGLVKTKIEDIKGRALLEVTLLTKNVIPDEDTVVALEIKNVGHAPARSVVVKIEDSPAYQLLGSSQTIPLLSPGNSQQMQFSIDPTSRHAFRILFNVSYLDLEKQTINIDFADQVQPLKHTEEFSHIVNPYSPGMPLRPDSAVFFGREDLFSFVRDNASQLSQRKVLIFVGQRRTGKTSALLQLHHHLPQKIIPAYIDCQSLGVTPGMAALLHDFAWAISDALSTRDIELPVPALASWSDDPAGIFQRKLLPMVREFIPVDATLLLIFDEFEAFQNLVDDDILPPTFFTFLRHLMQHEPGLSFVFAGTHKLEEIGSDYWSVLFNIALYRHVGYLSEDASRLLITKPVEPHVIFDDLAVAKILRVTAGHPYFLQLVCYTLINRANTQKKNYVTISDVNAGIDEMLRLGEVHFAYLWQRSSYVERALLVAAAQLMTTSTPFSPVDLVQFLEQYSIHIDPADVTTGLESLIEREIFTEIREPGKSLFDLKIGLVGIWVSQNKSLSRLQDRGHRVPAKD